MCRRLKAHAAGGDRATGRYGSTGGEPEEPGQGAGAGGGKEVFKIVHSLATFTLVSHNS